MWLLKLGKNIVKSHKIYSQEFIILKCTIVVLLFLKMWFQVSFSIVALPGVLLCALVL